MNEAKLREYAELIVKIGANVQKGNNNDFTHKNILLY